MYLMMSLIMFELMIMLIMIMISVSFLTLGERKILGYIQNRKGPNKMSFKGLLQSICNAIKLMMKECSFFKKWMYFLF